MLASRAVRIAPLLATLSLLAGCNRSFSTPAAPPSMGVLSPVGLACADAGECASALCTDGVCCATVCDQTETCNQAAALGTCTPRPLGTACTDGTSCPSGNCVDGVCCDSLCDAPCYSCAQPGDAGQCLPAADDTDPRQNCGMCAACFSGVCNPAIAGTDPHGDCTSMPGGTCAQSVCAKQDGATCAIDDDCAIGFCIGFECVDIGYVRLDNYPFLPIDQIRQPLSVVVDKQGAALMAVTIDESTADAGPIGTLMALMAPDEAGPWAAVALDYDAPIPTVTAVAMIGDVAYFAVANGAGLNDFGGDPGIYVEGFRVDGTYVSDDQVDVDDLFLSSVNGLALAAQDDGRLVMGASSPDAGVLVIVRGVDSSWSEPQQIAPTADGIAGATVGGKATLLYAANGQLHAVGTDGVDHASTGTPPGCTGAVALAVAPAHETAGDVLGFTVVCGGVNFWGVYNPLPNAPSEWTFVAAALDLPGTYCSTGLPDPDPACPIYGFLPVGGFGETVLYASFTPGPDSFGFTSMFTLEPDGGYTSGGPSTPDTGFSFLSAAGTSNPDGVPILLLGSAVVADAGSSIDGELLVQDWYLFTP